MSPTKSQTEQEKYGRHRPVTDRDAHEINRIEELSYDLKVHEVMIANVITTTSDVPISSALELLRINRISGLPVVDNGILAGVISLEDIVRNQVFLESTYEEIVSQRKSREIKKRISREISMRMRGFGIVINEEFGAMPVDIQPHQTYFEAVQTSRAAAPLGEAALERLRPVLNELNRIKHEDARTAFLLELASKIAEVKDLPEIVMPSMDGNATGEGRDAKRILRGGKAIYPEPGRSQQGKYPLAE